MNLVDAYNDRKLKMSEGKKIKKVCVHVTLKGNQVFYCLYSILHLK